MLRRRERPLQPLRTWRAIPFHPRGRFSGADMSEISFYGLDVNTKDLFPQVSFIYDGQKDPENPWFVRYTHEEDPEPLTEEEWQSGLSNFGELYTPEAAPLSDIG